MSKIEMLTRGSLVRFRVFCRPAVVENRTALSSRLTHTTEDCGVPSGLTVATVAKFLPSRILRTVSSKLIVVIRTTPSRCATSAGDRSRGDGGHGLCGLLVRRASCLRRRRVLRLPQDGDAEDEGGGEQAGGDCEREVEAASQG